MTNHNGDVWEVTIQDLANPETVSEILNQAKGAGDGGHPPTKSTAQFAVMMTNTADIVEAWGKVPESAGANDLNRTFQPTEISIANDIGMIATDNVINTARLLVEMAKEPPLTEDDLERFEATLMQSFELLLSKAFQLSNIQQERKNLIAGMFTNN